jgi:hypothetical protein
MTRQSRHVTAAPPATDPREPRQEPADDAASAARTAPLTAALLRVARNGLSFATPGHRGGRSCPDWLE